MAATFTPSESDLSYVYAGKDVRRKVIHGVLNLGSGVSSGGVAVTPTLFHADADAIIAVAGDGPADDGSFHIKLNAAKTAVEAWLNGTEVTGDLSAAGKNVQVTVTVV